MGRRSIRFGRVKVGCRAGRKKGRSPERIDFVAIDEVQLQMTVTVTRSVESHGPSCAARAASTRGCRDGVQYTTRISAGEPLMR